MTHVTRSCFFVVLLAVMALAATSAHAKALPDGTVISAENLQSVLDDTYLGHKIGDMITERQTWMIEKHNLKIRLGDKAPPFKVGARYWELTKEHAGEAKLNPKTRQLENWSGAGMPFPMTDIKADDPHAGDKLVWDFHVYQTAGDTWYLPYSYLFINGNKGGGIERVQDWLMIWYQYMGRFGKDSKPNINKDGEEIYNKVLVIAQYPKDIRGIGALTTSYLSDKPDVNFAYLPAVRRIRRLSGGTWMDPIGGTDQLNDDINIFNTHPNWYPSIKVIGTRWILTPIAGYQDWSSFPKKSTEQEKYPHVDLSAPPYWNPTGYEWQPRHVYVVEADAPPVHPYSKKIMYMDMEIPWIYQGEAYDKKGEFWKYLWWVPMTGVAEDGTRTVTVTSGYVLDYQRMHGTVFVSTPAWKFNDPKVTEAAVSLGGLQAAAQ